MAPVEAVEITNAKDDKLEVTLRGAPEEIVKVLVSGLPREALAQIKDALEVELTKRHDEASGAAS